MIRENEQVSKSMFRIYLLILTVVTFFSSIKLAQIFVNSTILFSSDYLALLLMLLPVWYWGLSKTSLLSVFRVNHYAQLFKQSVKFIILAIGILFGFINLMNLTSISKEVVFIFGILNHLTICVSYVAVNQYYMERRKKGINLKNVIIIADEENESFIENIANHRELGYNITMIIADSPKIFDRFNSTIKVVKKTMSLSCLIKSQIVDEVLYCKSNFNSHEVQHIMNACKEVGVVFRLNSQMINQAAVPNEIHHLNSIPFITYKNKPSNEVALGWKYVFDFSFSMIVIMLWMPIFIVIGLMIKFTSKGPIIFKQKRVGLHGREFYIYKFRTMMVDAEKMQAQIMHQNEASGPVFKIKNDPRITSIGKFLRKTSLDELPQFFNVLKGDMSLVGPRPPIMNEVNQYKPWQIRRLSMRPGLTCTWQIMPRRNSISFDDWMKLDLQYIDNWSLQQDFMLTFKTVRAVIMGSGQ
ncbi:MAG: sugar transferase [Saprospiraceae bacterium]|nr:sugar transferase [Saprospiraceae bacterium]